MADLDELDRLHAAATAGPWEVYHYEGYGWRLDAATRAGIATGKWCEADADFIVALHNAWPDVSARLRAAEAEVERLRALSAEARDMLRDMPWRRGGDALVTRLDRAALGEP